MGAKSGMKAWIAAGVALLVAVAIVPALAGAANAAPVATATTTSASPWSYGGEGWSNGTIQIGNATINWTGMYGWTATFTVTQTSPGIWMVEEQRTVGATLVVTLTTPVRLVQYHYHAQEVDTAFANLTNASTVYVNDSAVPALGILNASATVNALVDQSIAGTVGGHTRSAYLNVTGSGHAQTSFSPSLGLIPLNLSGIDAWNSSATASPSAAWTLSWTWSEQGFNGTVRSGSGSANGGLSATATVTVQGYKVPVRHTFTDGKTRVGIVLIVQGPFDCYDAFILIPQGLDLFGGAVQPYDSVSFGASTISAEKLYVSAGPGGPAVTAADQTFGSTDTAIASQAAGTNPSAAGPTDPGTTVYGQPLTSAQTQAIDHGLTNTGSVSSSPAAMSGGLLIGLVAAAAVIAVLGTVGVIEWRSYARRRSKGGLVGGYGESWPNGVPPAAATPPGSHTPTAPTSGPESVQDPNRPQ